MTTDDRRWTPPTEFEEYRLLDRLGGGAMGEVYLAQDVLLQRAVAIKFLRAPDAAASERLYIEARAIARVQHPNVVTVYRVGRVAHRPYLVSERIDGVSLDQLPRPLPPARVIALGQALAAGLGAAHRRGVLHRDLKPTNAVLGADGVVKLLDFGLAKLLDEQAGAPAAAPTAIATRPGLALADTAPEDDEVTSDERAPLGRTQPGSLLGSPLYMAPELWRGEAATVASDLYALGIVLYELCAGHAPFHDRSLDELRHAATHEPIADLGALAPLAPTALLELIAALTACEAAERPVSAESVRWRLAELANGPTAGAGADAAEPYPGLRPFGPGDRRWFFGRAAAAAAVLERLRGEPLVVITGDSGSGKSSLCAAAIAPAVVEGGLGAGHGARRWSLVTLRPGRHPARALAVALAEVLESTEADLECALHDDPAGLAAGARRQLGRDRGLLLWIDQLEELVTVASADQARAVAVALAELALPSSGVRLLAAARSDTLTRLASLPGLGPLLPPALVLMPPLDDEGVRAAIVEPARIAGVRFESTALVDALAAAADGGTSLPLLQFALAALWSRRDRVHGVMTAAALTALGGVAGAMTGHADEVLATLAPAPRAAVRDVILRLITADGTRVTRTADELDATPAHRDALAALVRGRLVVTRGEGAHATFELAHEALIDAWPVVAAWRRRDHERRATAERLERAAREWRARGRPRDGLWSPRQLAEASTTMPTTLGAEELGFVAASRRAIRRRRLALATALAAGVAAGVIGFVGARVGSARRLDRRIAAERTRATTALADADRALAEVERLRAEALAAFDAAPLTEAASATGEERWSQMRAAAADLDGRLARAERALTTALMLDGHRAAIRRALATTLQTRATLAARTLEPARQGELLDRLAAIDPDGLYTRQRGAPARLAIRSRPDAILSLARYGEPPARRLEPTRTLGASPQAGVEVAPGSYLLILTASDRPPLRLPLRVEPGEQLALDVAIPADVPAGYVYIPPGRFLFGSDDDDAVRRGIVTAQPLHLAATGGYLIARHEVTFGDWIGFLDDLPDDRRAAHTPLAANEQGLIRLDRLAAGWRLTLQPEGVGGPVLVAMDQQPLRYPGRTRRADVDWRKLPVSGIAWDDVLAYAAWLDRTGRLPRARPCTEREWQRAARGADERDFPAGDQLAVDDASFDVTYGRVAGGYGPDEVGAHPASDSPFGVADLAGNVYEWTRSMLPEQPVFHSASFYRDAISNRVTNRSPAATTLRNNQIGARICADPAAIFDEGAPR